MTIQNIADVVGNATPMHADPAPRVIDLADHLRDKADKILLVDAAIGALSINPGGRKGAQRVLNEAVADLRDLADAIASGRATWAAHGDVTIAEMFTEHQEIFHQEGDIPQERLDRMVALHDRILSSVPVSAVDLAQQVVVHLADGDNVADTDEIMNMVRPIAGITSPPPKKMDTIFEVVRAHRKVEADLNAVIDADGESAAAEALLDRAEELLGRTVPTTLVGALHLCDYMVEVAKARRDIVTDGWSLDESANAPEVRFETVILFNIAKTLRGHLPTSLTILSDLMTEMAKATPEVKQMALEFLRNGQRKDGADVQ